MDHPRDVLNQSEIEPKKSLGQNFLFDQRILARIVEQAELTDRDQILEIGAGLGSLTLELAKGERRVVAVELDDRLIPHLQVLFKSKEQVELIHGDILDQNLALLFPGSDPYKVVANVPYYITGGITRHLLSSARKPDVVVLTVQKDVADRMTASAPNMSLLSVSVQLYGKVKSLFNLSAGSFYPRPKVASSVVKIDLRGAESLWRQVSDEKTFFKIVKAGFSQKRKQLLNNLTGVGLPKSKVGEWCEQAGIDSRRRAETLTLPEWVSLYNLHAQFKD